MANRCMLNITSFFECFGLYSVYKRCLLKVCVLMKSILSVLLLLVTYSQSVLAQDSEFAQFLNIPYSQARSLLLQQGWQVVRNPRIDESSMVAQNVHITQFEEVLDCISMERDQCQFVLAKGKHVVVVTTKDKTFTVESIKRQR